MENEARIQFVTKPVMEKVDNLVQIYIWNQIVKKLKLKADEAVEIKLVACEECKKQRISVVTEDGEISEYDDCIQVPTLCNEEILVFYDKEKNSEYMLLKSDFVEKTAEASE